MGLYRKYVDKMSAASGAAAFANWLFVSVALQFVTTFLSVPIVLLANLAPPSMREALSAWLFLICFFAARVVICVIPAFQVADRKGRHPWMWAGWTFVFGQFALALLAALPRTDAAPAA